jgi:inward rectifier potassium channel
MIIGRKVDVFPRIPNELKSRLVRIGNLEVEARGLSGAFWSDLYYRSMTVSWPYFFGSAALIFIVLNSVFAVVYSLGDHPVANVASDSFVDLMYFSIETLATVGYGDMHPQTNYGHIVATVEIFTGMSFLAVMTGLVFARFSRPKARFIFARHPVVAQHEGQPTLMIRVANARLNIISGATARLWLIRNERTAEGVQLRRYYELRLLRNENPVFALTWTIFHPINASSTLHELSADDLERSDAILVLTVAGADDNSMQQLNARQVYSRDDIRWQHNYVDITTLSDEGRFLIDYSKFHDVVPEPAPKAGRAGSGELQDRVNYDIGPKTAGHER